MIMMKKKSASLSFSLIVMALSIGGLLISLTACGIKPSRLDPPPGYEDTTFPGTYPKPPVF
jgi:hypothetical protein